MKARASWWVVGIAVLVGAAIRIAEVTQGHSLGFDDTMLAVNIVTRPAAALMRPLAFEQTAPVFFLLIDRLLAESLGTNGVVLRLLPLVGGIAVLPLTWVVGRRLVSEPAAALAVALLAVSPLAVDYTDTVKPYIVDAAASLVLVGLTTRVIGDAESIERWVALAVGGAVAMILSTPAVLAAAACGGALALAIPPSAASSRRLEGLVNVVVVWSIVAGINHLAFQRPAAQNPYLQRFWGSMFFSPTAPDLALRVRVVFSSYVQNLFFGTNWRTWIVMRVAVAGLVAIGLARQWRRPGPWAAVLLAGPLALAVLAAAARVYPPSDRTWVFAAPFVVLLAASGVVALVDRFPIRARRPMLVAAGVVGMVLPARQSWLALRAKLAPDDLTSAMRAWHAEARRGEPIYVFSRDAVRWAYHTTDWEHPDTARLGWLLAAAERLGPNSGNTPSRGRAVRGEGDGLVYQGRDRAELIGVPTGMEDRLMTESAPQPDTGWADNEVRRMSAAVRAATPNAWMFFWYCAPTIDSTMLAAAERQGGRVISRQQFGGVRLYRLAFESRPPLKLADMIDAP
jgi:hypothetical protein